MRGARGRTLALAALPAVAAAATVAAAGPVSALPVPALPVSALPVSALPAAASPVAGPATDVRVLRDLRYAGTSPAQVLDLWLPASTARRQRPVPLVVLVHGGAFTGGDKGQVLGVPELLAQGFAVASVNYRLADQAPFPAAVQDVKAAVRWLRANAGSYDVDRARFAVWGTSAGGYLATMAGVSGGQWSGLDDVSLGNPTVSSQVQAVVSWYGPADFTAMDAEARQVAACAGRAQVHDAADSPESRWLGAPVQTAPLRRASDPGAWLASAPPGTLPPFLLVHGGSDCLVPPGQSARLGQALAVAGAPVRVQVVEGAGHADEALHRQVLRPSIDFIAAALQQRPAE